LNRGRRHGTKRSAGKLLQRANASYPVGTLEMAPQKLFTLISTGKLPSPVLAELRGDPAVEDPAAAQAAATVTSLEEYKQRLEAARLKAEEHYEIVAANELALSQQFAPIRQQLKDMIKATVDQASKAEVAALLERLERIRSDQTAMYDRTARFWEERLAREKELRRITEAKIRLEESAELIAKTQNVSSDEYQEQLREVEQANLDSWLDGFDAQLKAEEEAIRSQAATPEEGQANLDFMREEVMKAVMKASGVAAADIEAAVNGTVTNATGTGTNGTVR